MLSKLLIRLGTFAAAVGLSFQAQAQTPVVVGYQQVVGPFIAAIADGSFDRAAEELGYKIDWRQFNSAGEVSTAMASEAVAIGVMGAPGVVSASSRGVELEAFWILDNIGKSEALVVRDGSGIEDPQDLKGRKVGVPFVSTSHFHLLAGLEKLWNISPREVDILNLKPPQIVAAWQRGDIDAAYVWPPAMTEILKSGRVLADSEEIGKASIPTFDTLVVGKKFSAANADFMNAFTRVLAEAYDGFNADPEAWDEDSEQVKGIIRIIGGGPEETVETLNLLSFPTLKEQISDQWLGASATEALKELGAFLVSQKQIDSALDDYSSFVNPDFAIAATAAK